MRRRGLLVCSAAVIAAGIVISDAPAQTGGNALFTYPMQGQTPEQESADRSACHNWAVQQTGFDPSAIFIAQQAGCRPGPSPTLPAIAAKRRADNT